MNGFVYAIECADFIKIGFSGDPVSRLSKIATDSPFPCRLLGFWPGSKNTEDELHKRFQSSRVKGEWFKVTDDITAFVKAHAVAPPRKHRRTSRNNQHPLTAYAERTGRSFTDIAKSAGVSRMTLYRLVNGEQNARISLLEQVSAATNFEVTASQLIPSSRPSKLEKSA